jgi:hypothetical protein
MMGVRGQVWWLHGGVERKRNGSLIINDLRRADRD